MYIIHFVYNNFMLYPNKTFKYLKKIKKFWFTYLLEIALSLLSSQLH